MPPVKKNIFFLYAVHRLQDLTKQIFSHMKFLRVRFQIIPFKGKKTVA